MLIEIWSDVVCPWCYVGARNLAAAVASFEHGDEVEIVWRSFELDPEAPPEREGSYAAHLARKYRTDLAGAQAMIDQMTEAGAAAGVELRFDLARPGNSFDAHRLLHLGRERGVQGELTERVFAAMFTQGRRLSDRETLVEIATEAGLAETDARQVLVDGDFADDVRAEESAAHDIGVQGVPFFVFDRRFAVSGAQPPKVMLEVLQRAWDDSHPDGPAGLPEGLPEGLPKGNACEL